MVQLEHGRRRIGIGRALAAGAAIGLLAAALDVAEVAVLGAKSPPALASAGAGFAAGVLGSLVYWWFARSLRRPDAALWITTIALATAIGVLEVTLPAAAGGVGWLPLAGLIAPLKQLGAAIGLLHFGAGHFPAAFVRVTVPMNYIPAILVAGLMPRWTRASTSRTRAHAAT